MSALTGTTRCAALWWRSGRWGVLAWVIGLVATMALTAASVASVYATAADRAAYARMQSAPAFAVLSGKVAGLDTIGGIMANEFGQVSAFALPLMGVALVVRGTRGEEQSGRAALLLAGPTGRLAPLLATLVSAAGVLGVTATGCGVVMAACGADAAGSVRYGLTLWLLGLVHATLAALLAQVLGSARAVWIAALTVVVGGYVLRGVGAVEGGAWAWFSPLGWQDAVRSFGHAPRWWPSWVSLGAAVLLALAALVLAARRDVGSALWDSRPGPRRAGAALRTPLGLALHVHGTAVLGWVAGAAVVMGAYGALTQTMVTALQDMPELQVFLGEGQLVDLVVASFLMLLGALAVACVVQGAGTWRAAEADGLLERELAGPRGRVGWWVVHAGVVTAGGVLVVLVGGLALGTSTGLATHDAGRAAHVLGAACAQLPVVALFAGLVTLLLGWLPEHRGAAWLLVAVGLAVGWLGPGLDLPQWVMDLGPFTAVGQVPAQPVDRVAAAVLVGLGVVLAVLGVVGFRRRDLPRV